MTDRDASGPRYAFGEFTLDLERGELSRGGADLHLRPKSFEVLRYLVQHAGRLVGKQELLDAVWGRTVVTEGSLTQCIADIRRAIGDDAQQMLRTVPRRGFILDQIVRELPGGPAPPDTRPGESGLPTVSPPAVRDRLPATAWLGLGVLAIAAVAVGLWQQSERPAAQPAPATTTTPAAAGSIAVLRFLDLSPKGDQFWFADGVAEEILHLLAQSPELRVTARGSSFAFEPGTTDIATVAEQLRVNHVVEGSVRRDGDALRITVQLIDARTQAHVWSRTYDRTLERVLEVQGEIAADVAAVLAATLERPRTSTSRGAAEAQEQFLLGRHLFLRRRPGDLAAAEQHFQRAVKLDPQHARAWAALAGACNARGFDELRDPTYRLEEQRMALERALAIDPTLAEAHVRLARYYFFKGNDYAGRRAFERARELAPEDPLVLASLARQAALDGRLDEAIELSNRVVARDPLSAVYRVNLSHMLLAAGRYEAALAELRRAQLLSPDLADIPGDTAFALLLLGRAGEARQAMAGQPEGPRRDQLQALLATTTEANAALARLQADHSARSRFLLAEIAAHRGDVDAAFELLGAARRAMLEPGSRYDFDLKAEVAVSPFLRALHDDPRWAPLREEPGSR